MLAFQNDPAIKAAALARVLAHQGAGQIVQRQDWDGTKGGAVGCTVHADDPMAYEAELGIPATLARIEEYIFQGMPEADAGAFPARFIDAIPLGADLALARAKLLHWLVADMNAAHGTDETKAGVAGAIDILRRKAEGEAVDPAEADAAAAMARAAANAARSSAGADEPGGADIAAMAASTAATAILADEAWLLDAARTHADIRAGSAAAGRAAEAYVYSGAKAAASAYADDRAAACAAQAVKLLELLAAG